MALSDNEFEALKTMMEALEPEVGSGILSEWQEGFIRDQISRFQQYERGMFLSDKQWEQIRKAYKAVTDLDPPGA